MSDKKEIQGKDHFEKLKAKLFDEKEFNTMIIGDADTTKKQGVLHELVLAIADNKLDKEEKDDTLKLLKDKHGKDTLISAIKKLKNPDKKALLIAACWEANIDCTQDFLFFVDLACSDNFRVAMEAYTVIENIENPIIPEELNKAEKQITLKIKESPDTLPLLNDLLTMVNNFKH